MKKRKLIIDFSVYDNEDWDGMYKHESKTCVLRIDVYNYLGFRTKTLLSEFVAGDKTLGHKIKLSGILNDKFDLLNASDLKEYTGKFVNSLVRNQVVELAGAF